MQHVALEDIHNIIYFRDILWDVLITTPVLTSVAIESKWTASKTLILVINTELHWQHPYSLWKRYLTKCKAPQCQQEDGGFLLSLALLRQPAENRAGLTDSNECGN